MQRESDYLYDILVRSFLNHTTFLDVEGTGARGRLDAVLKGLVEKSENERFVKLIVYCQYSLFSLHFNI